MKSLAPQNPFQSMHRVGAERFVPRFEPLGRPWHNLG